MIRWDQDINISWTDSLGNEWNAVLEVSFTADKHYESGWGVDAQAKQLKDLTHSEPLAEVKDVFYPSTILWDKELGDHS